MKRSGAVNQYPSAQVGGKYCHIPSSTAYGIEPPATALLHHEALALHSLPGWAHFLPVGRTVYLYLPDHHTLIHSGGLLGAGPVCWPSELGDDVALIFAFYPLGQCSVSIAGQVRLVFCHCDTTSRAVSAKPHTERLVGGALDMAVLPGGPAQSLSPYLQQVSWVLMECAPYPPWLNTSWILMPLWS